MLKLSWGEYSCLPVEPANKKVLPHDEFLQSALRSIRNGNRGQLMTAPLRQIVVTTWKRVLKARLNALASIFVNFPSAL